jgi:hypothetical protein
MPSAQIPPPPCQQMRDRPCSCIPLSPISAITVDDGARPRVCAQAPTNDLVPHTAALRCCLDIRVAWLLHKGGYALIPLVSAAACTGMLASAVQTYSRSTSENRAGSLA